jgi:hypothetical protein
VGSGGSVLTCLRCGMMKVSPNDQHDSRSRESHAPPGCGIICALIYLTIAWKQFFTYHTPNLNVPNVTSMTVALSCESTISCVDQEATVRLDELPQLRSYSCVCVSRNSAARVERDTGVVVVVVVDDASDSCSSSEGSWRERLPQLRGKTSSEAIVVG